MGNKASHSASAAQEALEALLARTTALTPDMFALASVAHHGVPSNAKTLAFCGPQGILAVGTAGGAVKLYGQDGLEVLLEVPRAQSSLTVGVTHMQFTAHQRLVVAYTDSSLRIFDLAADARGATASALLLAEVPSNWTTSVITELETIAYTKFPFFFVATDDNDVHVVHEDTGRVSTYVIRPQDLSVAYAEGVTALASHPRDSNQLLLAYDTCPVVLLWDFAKRKVVREFSLSGKAGRSGSIPASPSSASNTEASGTCNSPQSLSWHSSGKRFVAGFKDGGFAVFRLDKPHGIYRRTSESAQEATPVSSIKWVCAPPTSRNAHLPGGIVFSGGRTSASESNLLTLLAPPNDGTAGDNALSELVKSEKLTWQVTTLESANHAEIAAFVVAQDQVDDCPKMAPLSVMVLSGNPLDGCLPAVSVQCLPCFVKLCEGDKEEWEWWLERLPESAIIPPLLQMSPLKTFEVVNLSRSDGDLQDDLFSTWEQEKYDPMFRVLRKEDFEWPINGGSVLEPTLKAFLTTSGVLGDGEQKMCQNSTLLVTGHANGYVLFWEILPPADRSSKGTLRLLHVVDIPLQMNPIPSSKEITSLSFCADSRMLVAGFACGEVAVLQFGHRNENQSSSHSEGGREDMNATQQAPAGFRALFSIHVHTVAVIKIALSSAYGYMAVADTVGMVSLVDLASQDFKLLIFDLAPTCDDSMSVDSMLMSELVQTTEIPGSSSSGSTSKGGKNRGSAGGVERKSSSSTTNHLSRTSSASVDAVTMVQHREVVPVLFIGRGSGKLEMYHIQSSTKMGETLVDPQRATSLSSIIMVDADGKRIEIPGRAWVDQEEGLDNIVSTASPTGNTASAEMVEPRLPTASESGKQGGNASMQLVHVSSAEFAYTKQVVLDAIHEQSDSAMTDTVIVQNEDSLVSASGPASSWTRKNVVEVGVPAGSLGLHLSMEVEQYAIVTGFVEDSSTAAILGSKGVRVGHIITSINGVELTSYGRTLVCVVLEKLRDREKVIVFAEGVEDTATAGSSSDDAGGLDDPLPDGKALTELERPRFLVCTCGKMIHLVQASVPRAAEMAMGPKEMPAQPLASVELQATVLVTSVIHVPAGERVENCLAVIDQSNRVYILSLLTLQVIWETEYLGFGFALGRSGLVGDILADITYGGELVVANGFGEMERFSLFAEATARESAMLERKSIKTRLALPERAPRFNLTDSPTASGSGKKRGIASDAGKMFKKLVLSVTQEATDLNKLFQFSTEDDERSRLMGGRAAAAAGTAAASADATSTAQVEQGANATKAALMQAQQRLAERGDKLNDLGLKTEQMKQTSADFYQTMKAFNEKNANKKWYEL